MIKKIIKTDLQWSKILSPEQFRLMRKRETEPAFSCEWKKHSAGTYHCVACNLPLFHIDSKFESGTGWPSYFKPIDPDHITEKADDSFGMQRTEVICTRCESHLGHVFDDGPAPTNKRYCINSVALDFIQDNYKKDNYK